MSTISININQNVRVRLKPHGREIYCRHYDFRLSPKEDDDGWTTMQLWHVMEVFGPHMHLACDPPFETTIELPVENASERTGGDGGA